MVLSKHIADEMKGLVITALQQHSWLAGVEGNDLPAKPGYKKIITTRENLIVVEVYNVISKGDVTRLTSTKTGYLESGEKCERLWSMRLSGHCRTKNLTFLRKALGEIYSDAIFTGKYEMTVRSEDSSLVCNNIAFQSKLEEFAGRSSLLQTPKDTEHEKGRAPEVLGYFSYSGQVHH